jgi:hypothetical protein
MNRQIVWEHWESFTTDDDVEIEALLEEGDMMDGSPMSAIIAGLDMGGPSTIDTPLGRYHPEDNMRPSRMFDCWIMHANFDIDGACVQVISEIPGVEVASVMTRYRVFIGVGKLFDGSEVKQDIQSALLGEPEHGTIHMGVDTLEEAQKHKHWAGLVTEDGEQYIYTDRDNDVEFIEMSTAIRLIAETNGYKFVSSDENDV